MLKIEGFTKHYADKCAVDNLSLHLHPGEICAFIGHNGAGKTTTLKACVGLIGFDAGDIRIDGISIREDPIKCKQNVAFSRFYFYKLIPAFLSPEKQNLIEALVNELLK